MKFIDEARITVCSGNGGRGCVSFRRERYVPRGGPDGGDGGKGGDVILKASSRKRTLQHFQHKRLFKAENGAPGQGDQKTGKSGSDIVVEVPPGTLVKDSETGETLADLVDDNETVLIAVGGRGGRGNKHFATSTNRAPRMAQPGEEGECRELSLELKLLADVGIIGLPNAGKSTLISAITAASPKQAEYPFTTIHPTLGVVKTDRYEPFVVADIPGLIEGAHEGSGLGIRFLKHIERTRILIHLIDVYAIEPDDPLSVYRIINRELEQYSDALAEKPQVITLNKMDLTGADELAKRFQNALEDKPVIRISAVTRKGIGKLLSTLVTILQEHEHGS